MSGGARGAIIGAMEYVTLGRTGLKVSVMGLGGGGHSRLGLGAGAPTAISIGIVERAADLGITFIDTAEQYRTETLIGEALKNIGRDKMVVSTKKSLSKDGRLITGAELESGLEESLGRLQTDHVDIYHLHAVEAGEYDYAQAEWVPSLLKLREQGKIRFLGITEQFSADPGHKMMARAVGDEPWDVIMAGFNLLNQSARAQVLAEAIRRNIGVLCMFAVRNALSKPEKLREVIAQLVQAGQIDRGAVDMEDPLGFITQVEGVGSVPEAAYRFCRAEPGIHVVLSGTGNVGHLEENAEAILKPPLPDELHQRLIDMFARVDMVSGE